MVNDTTLDSVNNIQNFLVGTINVQLSVAGSERYRFIARTLKHTGYTKLTKKEKSIVREYLQRCTDYSHTQLTRLIRQYTVTHWIGRKFIKRNRFARQYTRADILLLAETDEAHQTLSGGATKKLFERAYLVYHDPNYERLANISIAHIYNLRKTNTYQCKRIYYSKTKSHTSTIGERRKPQPNNQPGYIRIDTVHQGDKDGVKGIYHINAVDEVTQMEVIFSVERISENCLIPVLEAILKHFPFVIINFHSDCGSEYINQYVAELLNKLCIEFTKSRSRHCNDNALAESKNGAIVRKLLGYLHIPQKWAPQLNEFHEKYLIPYINYHRPCYFPEVVVDKKGKVKKKYPYKEMMTPYERFKSLPNAEQYLKPDVTFEVLKAEAMAITDLEAAKQMKKAQEKLYRRIFAE